MKQKDRTIQKPQTSPYHEHDPLPQGALPESPAVASANECTGLKLCIRDSLGAYLRAGRHEQAGRKTGPEQPALPGAEKLRRRPGEKAQ